MKAVVGTGRLSAKGLDRYDQVVREPAPSAVGAQPALPPDDGRSAR